MAGANDKSGVSIPSGQSASHLSDSMRKPVVELRNENKLKYLMLERKQRSIINRKHAALCDQEQRRMNIIKKVMEESGKEMQLANILPSIHGPPRIKSKVKSNPVDSQHQHSHNLESIHQSQAENESGPHSFNTRIESSLESILSHQSNTSTVPPVDEEDETIEIFRQPFVPIWNQRGKKRQNLRNSSTLTSSVDSLSSGMIEGSTLLTKSMDLVLTNAFDAPSTANPYTTANAPSKTLEIHSLQPPRAHDDGQIEAVAFTAKPASILMIDCERDGKTRTKMVQITNSSGHVNTFKLFPVPLDMQDFVSVQFTVPGKLSPGMACSLKVSCKSHHALKTHFLLIPEFGAATRIEVECRMTQCSPYVRINGADAETFTSEADPFDASILLPATSSPMLISTPPTTQTITPNPLGSTTPPTTTIQSSAATSAKSIKIAPSLSFNSLVVGESSVSSIEVGNRGFISAKFAATSDSADWVILGGDGGREGLLEGYSLRNIRIQWTAATLGASKALIEIKYYLPNLVRSKRHGDVLKVETYQVLCVGEGVACPVSCDPQQIDFQWMRTEKTYRASFNLQNATNASHRFQLHIKSTGTAEVTLEAGPMQGFIQPGHPLTLWLKLVAHCEGTVQSVVRVVIDSFKTPLMLKLCGNVTEGRVECVTPIIELQEREIGKGVRIPLLFKSHSPLVAKIGVIVCPDNILVESSSVSFNLLPFEELERTVAFIVASTSFSQRLTFQSLNNHHSPLHVSISGVGRPAYATFCPSPGNHIRFQGICVGSIGHARVLLQARNQTKSNKRHDSAVEEQFRFQFEDVDVGGKIRISPSAGVLPLAAPLLLQVEYEPKSGDENFHLTLPCYIQRLSTSESSCKSTSVCHLQIDAQSKSEQLRISSKHVDFGVLAVKGIAQRELVVDNCSDHPLTIHSSFLDPYGPFSCSFSTTHQPLLKREHHQCAVEGLGGVVLAPKQSCTLLITFRPTKEEICLELLELRSVDRSSSFKIKLEGRAVVPSVVLDPLGACLDVGDFFVGESTARRFTLHNTSPFPISCFTHIPSTSPLLSNGSSAFRVQPQSVAHLASNTSQEFILIVEADGENLWTATISINIEGHVNMVRLQCTARSWMTGMVVVSASASNDSEDRAQVQQQNCIEPTGAATRVTNALPTPSVDIDAGYLEYLEKCRLGCAAGIKEQSNGTNDATGAVSVISAATDKAPLPSRKKTTATSEANITQAIQTDPLHQFRIDLTALAHLQLPQTGLVPKGLNGRVRVETVTVEWIQKGFYFGFGFYFRFFVTISPHGRASVVLSTARVHGFEHETASALLSIHQQRQRPLPEILCFAAQAN